MYGHRVDGFDIVEPAGQYETHAALTVVAREGHAQYRFAGVRPFALGQLEGDTNVAIHQSQAVVVARHQYRTALVPLLIAFDQACLE